MADEGLFLETAADDAGDVAMGGEELVVEISSVAAGAEEGADNENGLPFQEEAMEDAPARVTYIDYLKSPVVGLLVGKGDEQALLTAHQALLTTSPFFVGECAKIHDEGVSIAILIAYNTPLRQII